jgi:glycosyltransferase involved in cell wall biosynthesis
MRPTGARYSLAEPQRGTRPLDPTGTDAAGTRALRVAAVGISTTLTCGVRDHATLLADALGEQGVRCSLHWLQRSEDPLRASRLQVRAWTQALSRELQADEPDAILLHYSVFSYSHRGLPLLVRPTLSALRATGIPLVSALHEYAYPWRRGGARGTVWAVTQRAALLGLMRASAAALVTTEWRAEWLASRAWLPSRRLAVAPIFSNLPPPGATARPHGPVPVVGLFGYAYEPATVALVLDALRALERAGIDAQLLLIGAPGAASPAAREWLDGALARGFAREPGFSGTLPAQELSDRLAACDVLLSAEPSGPTSRKTTLAASLASGRPVLALDGPRTWRELIAADAAIAVQPSANAFAGALADLLADGQRRESLGARGRAFAAQTMTSAHSAQVLAGLLEGVLSAGS